MKELGIAFNAHLFRHLAAFTFLKRHPGQYEVVRRLLGHKNLETTTRFYCGLEDDAAFRRYAELICERRPNRKGPDPRKPK